MALGAAARGRYPLLSRTVRGGKRLVYLDNAATTQKPAEVLAALEGYYSGHNANVHRGMHALSEEATALYEGARATVGEWFGAKAAEVAFLRGTTEAINLVAWAWGSANLAPGDRVLCTVAEHHSNLVPWQMACARAGATLVVLPLGEDDLVCKESLAKELSQGAKVVAFTAQSNVLGAAEEVAAVAAMARAEGALSVVDAAQAAAHRRVDLAAWGCDLVGISGHKMLAPMGIGALVGREEALASLPPFLGGGEMIVDVREQDADYAPVPAIFEAGTMNVGGAIALAKATEVMAEHLEAGLEAHVTRLCLLAREGLAERGAMFLSHATPHGVVAWQDKSHHPHDLAHLMDQEGVAVRAGHHCAKPLHRLFGMPSSLRASFHAHNDEDDVAALLTAYDSAREFLS